MMEKATQKNISNNWFFQEFPTNNDDAPFRDANEPLVIICGTQQQQQGFTENVGKIFEYFVNVSNDTYISDPTS